MSLGTAWVLDGLEIALAGSVARVLTDTDALYLSSPAVGAIATVSLLGRGACLGRDARGQTSIQVYGEPSEAVLAMLRR